jgi:hypothetical protein
LSARRLRVNYRSIRSHVTRRPALSGKCASGSVIALCFLRRF